jgi:hypothetical protein
VAGLAPDSGLPVVLDLALEVDLLGDGGPTQKADGLFPLSKEGFKHRVIDELWRVTVSWSLCDCAADGGRRRRRVGAPGGVLRGVAGLPVGVVPALLRAQEVKRW